MNAADQARMEQWLAKRREHITTSDLPAVMDLPGAYGSKLGVYLDKKGLAERGETPEHLYWGLRLQQPILIGYAERIGEAIDFLDPYELAISAACPTLGASLDARRQGGDRRPVDAKNVGVKDPEEWGEPGTDEIPARYVAQGHGQMDVTETTAFDLAVLFGGRRLVIYTVPRDEEIIAGIRDAAETFMVKHVRADIPPPVDASAEWTRFLASRKQRYDAYLKIEELDLEKAVEATKWVNLLEEAKAAKAAAEERESLAGNHVRELIGDHAGLIVPGARLHYKQNKPRTTTEIEYEAWIAALEEELARIDPARALLPSTMRQRFTRTTTTPGARPLILKTTKEAKKE